MASKTGVMLGVVPWPNMHLHMYPWWVSHIVFFYGWWTEAPDQHCFDQHGNEATLLNIGSSESDRGTQFHFIAHHQHCKTRLQLSSNPMGSGGDDWGGGGVLHCSFHSRPTPSSSWAYTKTDSQADSEGECTGPKFPNSWNHKFFGDHNRITHFDAMQKNHVPRNTLMNSRIQETRGTRRKALGVKTVPTLVVRAKDG